MMNYNNLILAKLVWDGGSVFIPEEMGEPRCDQMQGTPAELLSEIAGRVCYDSLGKGRPSFTNNTDATVIEGYHDHILKVGHGSVLEHYNFTIQINNLENVDKMTIAWLCMNRPGVLLLPCRNNSKSVRITTNLRSVVEWEKFTKELYVKTGLADSEYIFSDALLRGALKSAAAIIAPHIVSIPESSWDYQFASPSNDHERWISMYLTGSRGLSHELVRHGDFTAISQRSTRFVDESEGRWVQHPLETEWREGDTGWIDDSDTQQSAKDMYKFLVGELEPWLIARGIDKLGARKQARGAARGYLGNALQTELIFSASVAQWHRMLRQRASVFADAEIRELFCKVLPELKRSRYSGSFENWNLQPSPDGIGQIAVEN